MSRKNTTDAETNKLSASVSMNWMTTKNGTSKRVAPTGTEQYRTIPASNVAETAKSTVPTSRVGERQNFARKAVLDESKIGEQGKG